MTTRFTRTGTAAAAALLALAVTACGSDSDSDSGSASGTDAGSEEPASTEPNDDTTSESDAGDGSGDEAESGETAAGLPLIAVGETFTLEAIGTFSATHLGLGDLGPITTLQGDDVQCYAILGEVTLVDAGDISGPSLSPQRADALDASGAVIDVNANAECPQSATIDAGYTGAFNVDWVEGTAETISFDIVSIPVEAVDQLDRIQITPATPDFELAATVTETL